MQTNILVLVGATLLVAPRVSSAFQVQREHEERSREVRGAHGEHEQIQETRERWRDTRPGHHGEYRYERRRVRGRDEGRTITPPAHYRRFVVHNERDLDVYRRPYRHSRGFRTYGLTYGLR